MFVPGSFRMSTLLFAAVVTGWTVMVGATAGAARADEGVTPLVKLTQFAVAPVGASKPDDITRLGDVIYVSYQNNAGKDGSPAGSSSTIVAFNRATGVALTTYSVPGRCDGLTADPVHHRLFATVNEDLNSSLFVITPGDATPLAQYTYSPNPAETGSDGTNGGTDAVSVAPDGTVYVAHSNPDPTLPAPQTPAAVYTITLSGATANLTRVFGVDDPARVINPAPGAAKVAPLGLTDPDSNRFIAGRDGGTLIQVAQGDSKFVFASRLRSGHPRLRQLDLINAQVPSKGAATPQLDDIERVHGRGLLYVVDQKGGNIYTVDTTGVRPGSFFVSQPAPSSGDLPNDPAVGIVDLETGVVTHVNSTLGSPKGLLFVPAAEHDPPDRDPGDHESIGQGG